MTGRAVCVCVCACVFMCMMCVCMCVCVHVCVCGGKCVYVYLGMCVGRWVCFCPRIKCMYMCCKFMTYIHTVGVKKFPIVIR